MTKQNKIINLNNCIMKQFTLKSLMLLLLLLIGGVVMLGERLRAHPINLGD